MTTESGATYPATLSIDYPDRDLDKLSTFFRILYAIPIIIVLSFIGGQEAAADTDKIGFAAGGGAGVLFAPVLLMIVFREKYPRWWYDFNLQLVRFGTRLLAYLGLMSDEYPSTDEDQYVHLEMEYPNVKEDLNRWLPLVKWLLAIPHYIVLFFLSIAAFFAVIFAWFAILFTGRYPPGIFEFVEGVFRWGLRVEAYAFFLTTDQYPPFSLD